MIFEEHLFFRKFSSIFDRVFFEQETGSTNDDIKSLIKHSSNSLTCFKAVERQSSGRGTHGKKWENAEKSMLFTVGVPLVKAVSMYQGVTLCIGFELVKVLQKHDIGAQLKWPNDLWYKQGKLGGILVEVAHSQDRTPHLIVGVGINLSRHPMRQENASGYAASDLTDSYELLDGNALLIDFACAIKRCIETFDESSLEILRLKWKDIDCFYNQSVSYTPVKGDALTVVNEGIDQLGRLRLRKGDTTLCVLDGVIRPMEKDREDDSFGC